MPTIYLRRGLALVAATALAATGLGLAAGPASAGTTVYNQNAPTSIGGAALNQGGAGVTINDNTTASIYPSNASVAGLVGPITDVNVTLTGLTHTFPDDIDILLVAPSGASATIMSDAGAGLDVSSINLTLDDQAPTALPDASQLTTGTFQPANYVTPDSFPAPAPPSFGTGSALSAFNGSDPNGTWSLYLVDDTVGDTGSLTGWTLAVTTTGPQPYPSTITVGGSTTPITDLNVQLNGLTHTFPTDIDLLLVGPQGQSAEILSDSGGGTDVNAVNLTLDDAAATTVPTPIVAGTYQPTNPGGAPDPFPAPAPVATGASALSVFNGTNPNGTWSLYVVDDSAIDSGSLAGWGLQITTVDAPASPVITAPAAGTRDRDGTFTVTGSAPSNESVKVLVDGVLKGTTTASAIGQWAVPVSGVHNGTHAVTATATDGFGNVSPPSAARGVIVDSVKPTVVSTVPANKAKHASTTANVTAKTSEAVRKLTVTKANAFIVVAGTTTHLKAKVTWKAGSHRIVLNPKTNLAHGTTYQVTITTKVLDLAGNPLDQNKSKAGVQKKTWKFTTK